MDAAERTGRVAGEMRRDEARNEERRNEQVACVERAQRDRSGRRSGHPPRGFADVGSRRRPWQRIGREPVPSEGTSPNLFMARQMNVFGIAGWQNRAKTDSTVPCAGHLPRAARVAVAALILLTGATCAMAIEEPDYQVVRSIDDVEIRDYAPYVVAEVTVAGPADEAGGEAFPILAGYIFGKNKGERRLPMTAPVTQMEAPVRLPMTAPVTQTAADGGYVVQFVLPKTVTLQTAPEPLDPRIRLSRVPAHRIASIRYAGLWSDANYAEHLARLKSVLGEVGLSPIGAPVFSRYNAPFTPWFLRRNEIWLPLAGP